MNSRNAGVPTTSRDNKSFHLPAWLPSLRAGGYGSKVQPLPGVVRGHVSHMRSSGNSAPTTGQHADVCYSRATRHQDRLEMSGSEIDGDNSMNICNQYVPV